ncbi:MAG: hypothetical protein M1828_004524 [Chrysothrix sp. TS-e1954]|nr:MAG: hypothetical protein M1828_004524 [Chrysothrix sp. TS-e1954]
MPPNAPRLRILSVGGNAVSAFLSWRLQATNACDVTLVWKSGFESVAQYGISFRSSLFGNERCKPRSVVRTPEEAAGMQRGSFDYVLLCIKALPDVYDMASIIESVVTPQHTCILINTSHSLGIESFIEKRFPKNVVLSLVSAVDISQLGPAEFEHEGTASLWVGPANRNSEIPASIQRDMAEALAMTLGSGQVDCKVSNNIQQQQLERMVGPIAFHTTSVLFETSNHAELLELTGVRQLISDTIDEILQIGRTKDCEFPYDFKERTMEEMIVPKEANSIMFQDYNARRPMEVETYLAAPIKLAKEAGVKVPRLETLYAMLHHVNIANQKRPAATIEPPSASAPAPTPRMMPPPPGRGPNGVNGMNGHHMNGPVMNGPPMRGRGSRAPSMNGPPPGMRRGPPPSMNGYGPPPMANGMPMGNGMPPRGPMMQNGAGAPPETNGLDEFSHLMLYDNPSGESLQGGDFAQQGPSDMALRERELMLRQKELALREREMNMRGGPRTRGPSRMDTFDEDEDGEDFFDPTAFRGPPVDPDNVDMMSITSRRNRKQPSVGQLRHNPEMGGMPPPRRGNPFSRASNRNRMSSTSRMMQEIPGVHESIMEDPLLGYSSDRYGALDRSNITREGRESRAGSLTAARLGELQQGAGYGGYPPGNRRTSQSPGNPLSPGSVMTVRPPPPPGHYGSNGNSPTGRPSPPDMRQPIPRHPPGHGNAVAPNQVEQHAGVSNLYPPKSGPQVRSLTGSASASAGSGDSGRSHQIESENSAYSSQASLGARPPIGVR